MEKTTMAKPDKHSPITISMTHQGVYATVTEDWGETFEYDIEQDHYTFERVASHYGVGHGHVRCEYVAVRKERRPQ